MRRQKPIFGWRRIAGYAAAAIVLAGLAAAIQQGEDGQMGNDREVSKAVYCLAAWAGSYSLVMLALRLLRGGGAPPREPTAT